MKKIILLIVVLVFNSFETKATYKYLVDSIAKVKYPLDSIVTISSIGKRTQRTSYSYNNNVQTDYYSYYMDGNQWKNSGHFEYIYDINGNQSKLNSYYWSNNNWILSVSYNYFYDENGLLISENCVQNNEVLDFCNYSNSNGKQISSTFYSKYDNLLKQFKNFSYLYDDHGNETDCSASTWDYYNNKWRNTFHYNYSYDSYNNKIGETASGWNDYTQSYSISNKEKIDYTYDTKGVKTSLICYKWYSYLNKWVGKYKVTYIYSDNSKLSEEIFYKNTRIDVDTWILDYTNKYYYKPEITTSINCQNNNIHLNFDPQKSNIVVNGIEGKAYIHIFDLYGHLLLSTLVYENKPVSVSSLNAALYLVKVYSKSGEFKMKFIKN